MLRNFKFPILVLFPAAILFALLFTIPWQPAKTHSPEMGFSAERAVSHLHKIATTPRPVGSKAHARAREYLTEILSGHGLKVTTQKGLASQSTHPRYPARATMLTNLIAKNKPDQNGKYILLLAHYDSVPNSPGAADDGAGVSVILEALNILKTDGAIPDGLAVLFSDAEEIGLLGAKYFVEHHPMADSIAVVVNLEARGSSGPVIMFETSKNNAGLIESLQKSGSEAFANSLTATVYRMLPNNTDFSPFRDHGIAGYNFGFIDGHPRYHTEKDNVENLNLASIDQMGNSLVALIRHLTDVNPALIADYDTAYFTLPIWGLVIYSYDLQFMVAFLLLLLLTLIIYRQDNPKSFLTKLLFPGIPAALFFVFFIPILVAQVYQFFFTPLLTPDGFRLFYQQHWLLLCALLLTISLQVLFGNSIQKWVDSFTFWMALLSTLVLLNFILVFFLPGVAFLLIWPLFFALAYLTYRAFKPTPEAASLQNDFLAAVSILPGIIILSPLIYLIHVGLSLQLVVAPLIVSAFLSCLIFPFTAGIRPRGVFTIAAISIVLTAGVAVLADFSTKNPRPTHLIYFDSPDLQTPVWYSNDTMEGSWLQALATSDRIIDVKSSLPKRFAERDHITIEAEGGLFPEPLISLTESQNPDSQHITIRVKSGSMAPLLYTHFPNLELKEVRTTDGKHQMDLSVTDELYFFNVPDSGLVLTFNHRNVSTNKRGDITVYDQYYGLPKGAPELPNWQMHNRFSNMSYKGKSLKIHPNENINEPERRP